MDKTSETEQMASQALEHSRVLWPAVDGYVPANSVPFRTLQLAAAVGELSSIISDIESGATNLTEARTRFGILKSVGITSLHLLSICSLFGIDLEKAFNLAINEMQKERRGGNGKYRPS